MPFIKICKLDDLMHTPVSPYKPGIKKPAKLKSLEPADWDGN